MKRLAIIIGVFTLSLTAIAQEALCPTPERAALAETRVWCAELNAGQACYGNSGIQAELLSETAFNTAGDIVPLTDVTRLSGRISDNQYGIAVMQTTGYSPDDWTAQPLTLMTLGDVSIANTGNEGINLMTRTAQITDPNGANIRTGPTTEYRLLTSLFLDDTIKLTGRLQDGTAYRVQLPSGETGWLASGAVATEDNDLPVVTVDETPPDQIYAPFTSFSLTTGIDDAPCAEAWPSGVLVQSSLDANSRLRINDQMIEFSGTLFLQAQESRHLIHVIEGALTYQDELIDAGDTLAIFEDGFNITAYDIAALAPLPTEALPRYTYIGVDLTTIITPAPQVNRSPIADVLVDAPCVLTTGEGGANLRAGPSAGFPIRGVLGFRETANPISRFLASDGIVWFELAQNVWVTSTVVVTGGDCVSLSQPQRVPVPLPTATPAN